MSDKYGFSAGNLRCLSFTFNFSSGVLGIKLEVSWTSLTFLQLLSNLTLLLSSRIDTSLGGVHILRFVFLGGGYLYLVQYLIFLFECGGMRWI